ncbi:MAG TPA: hypothetical protein VGO46_08335, partial [Gemmatimonadaceae bacterium]|nr:hypothetical protein [Gemmatimonadaceae bacterium]
SAALLLACSAPALTAQEMPGMDMSSSATAMSGDEMPMSHMTMTKRTPLRAGDAERAAAIADTVGRAIQKYRDYHVALDEGFTIFLPNVPQKVYHFTSKSNGLAAIFSFDPARPTSLLYRKTGDGYQLVGAMFTAPKRDTPEQLNERVPLSVAEWHMHTNLCLPPRGQSQAALPVGRTPSRFGFRGTISTAAECAAAGGRFLPSVFGWMVHVSPWEKNPALVWGTHEDGEATSRSGH